MYRKCRHVSVNVCDRYERIQDHIIYLNQQWKWLPLNFNTTVNGLSK